MADQKRLGHGLQALTAEDQTFRFQTDQRTGQVVVAGRGELYLEIIVDRLKREFGVEASVGKPQVAYKETLTVRSRTQGRATYSMHFERYDPRSLDHGPDDPMVRAQPRPVRPSKSSRVALPEPNSESDDVG